MGVSLTVAEGAPETLTTSASPIDANPLVQTYAVTTGGSGGVEIINLPLPDLPIEGFANGDLIGRRVTVYFVDRPDPADQIGIIIDGDETNWIKAPIVSGSVMLQTNAASDLRLTYPGSAVSFEWQSDEWVITYATDGFTFTDNNSGYDITPPSGTQLSFNGDDTRSPNLPTTDPGVAGKWFTDGAPSAGVPKAIMVSGGPA